MKCPLCKIEMSERRHGMLSCGTDGCLPYTYDGLEMVIIRDAITVARREGAEQMWERAGLSLLEYAEANNVSLPVKASAILDCAELIAALPLETDGAQ